MSAIYGQFHRNGRPVDPVELVRMRAALQEFGPQRSDIWSKANVGLGHCLMAFTPEDALERQPVIERNEYVLVSDARIDNRQELADELQIASAEAASLPDSAFVMRAFLKWDIEAPVHLVGAFSLAFYDILRNRLLLAVSPRGERTLFYHETPDSFYFSTAPKGLFSLPCIPRLLDIERVADYLAGIPGRAGASFYSRIHAVIPGHCLVVEPHGRRSWQFWAPHDEPPIRHTTDAACLEAFVSLLERVVGDHLRSVSGTGIMMSGGFDSASLAAVAAAQLAHRNAALSAFTEVPTAQFRGLVPRGRYADETPFVRSLAAMYPNVSLHLVRTDDQFFLHDIDRLFEAAEAPVKNASNRVWWEAILADAGKRQTRVLLTGGAGNLTISWAGAGLLTGLISQGKWSRAWAEAQATRMPELNRPWRELAKASLPLFPAVIQDFIRSASGRPPRHRLWRTYSPISPAFAREQHMDERVRQLTRFRGHKSLRARRIATLVNANLENDVERGHSAMFGCDVRHPAEDQRMVRFCLSLPEEQYRRNGESRWLLRRAMAGRLPDRILQNPLRGLQSADWAERLRKHRPFAISEVERMKRSPLASHLLDLDSVRQSLESFAHPGGRDGDALRHRALLERALVAGAFLMWFESGSRPS